MIASLLVAATLFQTQEQVLEQARNIGHLLFMGQVCEAVEKTSFDYEALLAASNKVTEDGARASMPDGAAEDALKAGYETTEAEMEAKYANLTDEMRVEIQTGCEDLMKEHPTLFKPFASED